MPPTTEKHANSKRIIVFRAGNFLDNAQTQAQEFMSMSKKSIGTYFASNLGSAIGTGLEFDEIDTLMPLVIDIPKDDRTFRPGVTAFFSNIVTNIPYGTGRELEIGLKLDNSKPVTFVDSEGKKNLPIHIQDYLRYRHLLRHPLVAASKLDALNDMTKQFYIFDQASVNEENASARKVSDEAIALYLAIKKDPEKVEAMLTLMGTDIRIYHGPDAEDLKLQKLYEYADKSATEFNKIYKADEFELRFTVQKMVNTGVIRRIGAQFVDKETGGVLGHNTEEVIYYLKDQQNSANVAIMKGKMQEAMKQKLAAPKSKAKTTVRT